MQGGDGRRDAVQVDESGQWGPLGVQQSLPHRLLEDPFASLGGSQSGHGVPFRCRRRGAPDRPGWTTRLLSAPGRRLRRIVKGVSRTSGG
ncbi:hypothetical protein GCM10010104_32280 [Streptomyces indiaensis]|uniref:Uncharacterized protein n=1 Tax=Streptomyces indiaensis TaxID=284033 RepID=A0ABP5QGA5_9ACTN